ncbi:MAG: replication-associated recombination protein A [Armatimonadetes bacterium]|nr:replication-associated recombination protein A [Armatimonadota bacterium]
MDLFAHGAHRAPRVPLAARMRPQTLDEMVGQSALLAPGSPLRTVIERDRLPSCVFHGPPGSGKSTLAEVIARLTSSNFVRLSAVESGVREIRREAEQARDRLHLHSRHSILFIDEVHRLNRTQQDGLLPHVESGVFSLIGATTESPWRTISSPLLSRCRVFEFERLDDEAIAALLRRAIADEDRGIARLGVEVSDEAVQYIGQRAEGDARVALNQLELAAILTAPDEAGVRRIGLAEAQAADAPALEYDRQGDSHYDNASAYIKSLRGSDVDAALYYLARMLVGGEDPRFVARRLVIQAAEDVGLADPMALVLAMAAAQAVEFVGMPEAQIPLAEATIYVAAAPKSNASYRAIAAATEAAKERVHSPVPDHLRNVGMGADPESYLYPHNYPGGWVRQEYLDEALAGRAFYEPTDRGREQKVKEWLERVREAQQGKTGASPDSEKGDDAQ